MRACAFVSQVVFANLLILRVPTNNLFSAVLEGLLEKHVGRCRTFRTRISFRFARQPLNRIDSRSDAVTNQS